jgi:hypothetical protein
MGFLDFLPAEPSFEPDPDECSCELPVDPRYLLQIEEGSVSLTHAACGKQPPTAWGDWHDLIDMQPIPVTLEWTPECDGYPWHGLTACDHGAYIEVTLQEPEHLEPAEGDVSIC